MPARAWCEIAAKRRLSCNPGKRGEIECAQYSSRLWKLRLDHSHVERDSCGSGIYLRVGWRRIALPPSDGENHKAARNDGREDRSGRRRPSAAAFDWSTAE